MNRFFYFSLLAGVVAGCGSAPEKPSDADFKSQSVKVRAADIGAAWPLTIPEAEVGCAGNAGAPSLVLNYRNPKTGKIEPYALNGLALQDGIPDLDTSGLWKPNPQIPGSYISIAPLTEAARATCAP